MVDRGLAETYREVKEVEKNMSVMLEIFQREYENSVRAIESSAQKRKEQIEAQRQDALDQVSGAKVQAMEGVDSEWQTFKEYSKMVRRAFLGESTDTVTHSYSLGRIKQKLEGLQMNCAIMQELAQRFESEQVSQIKPYSPIREQSCSKSQSIFKIPLNVSSPSQVMKARTEQSIEISPIQSKKQLPHHVDMHPERDKPEKINDDLLYRLKNKKESEIAKRKISKEEKNQQQLLSKDYSSRFKTQIVDSLRRLSKEKVTDYSSPRQDRFERTHNPVTSGGRLRFNISPETSSRAVFKFESSSRLPQSPPEDTLLTRVRSEETIGIGYKNCLEGLQRQQLQYDRLKLGRK